MIDITGQRSGSITAIGECDPWILPDGRKQRMFDCVCDCGNHLKVRLNDFRSGKSTSCGCKRTKTIKEVKVPDMVGKTFGRLTVVKYSHSENSSSIWECKCECGSIVYVSTHSLKSGNTKSCGCYKKDITSSISKIDIIGKTFNHLTVLDFDHKSGKKLYYKCVCDCGSECVVNGYNLRSGKTKSCGHICSVMEDTVNQYLMKHHYDYIYHKTFDDLKRINLLEFDFALIKDNEVVCLIECQGEQHYKNVGVFGSLQRNQTDKIKKDYCEKHGIPLYEIKYSDDTINKLEEIINEMHVNPVPRL